MSRPVGAPPRRDGPGTVAATAPLPPPPPPRALWARSLNRLGAALALLHRPLADAVFVSLLVAAVILAGWLAARHDRYWDWTRSGHNSLSPQTEAVLGALQAPLHIAAYVGRDHPLAGSIDRLVGLYAQALPDLKLSFIDPQFFPEQARTADVTVLGQLVLEYQGRRETLRELSEGTLTAAIARLASDRPTWVAALVGHGERSVMSPAGADLGRFGQLLQGQGLRVQALDLAVQDKVPDETDVLLVSTPAVDLFPGEVEYLVEYLRGGGNLLWLMDPGTLGGLDPLAQELGLRLLPGTIVDANARGMGIDTPTVALVADYPNHPMTAGLKAVALLPGAVALAPEAAPGWTIASRLATGAGSWNETGPIRGELSRDPAAGEEAGPLAVALALTRPSPRAQAVGQGEQRVLVVGDGDFLSNANVAQGGNRDLGLRLVGWASGQQGLDAPPERWAGDREVELTDLRRILVGGLSLVVLPLVFLISGLVIRWYRWRG
jgi:ABC-type uncharacterized transport system involved in gliding motility auxiliary subunit